MAKYRCKVIKTVLKIYSEIPKNMLTKEHANKSNNQKEQSAIYEHLLTCEHYNHIVDITETFYFSRKHT